MTAIQADPFETEPNMLASMPAPEGVVQPHLPVPEFDLVVDESSDKGGVEYQILGEHDRTDGTNKTLDQLKMEYIHLTDELVRQMTEGVPVTDRLTGERKVERPDVVVWLDKSARPLAWLTRAVWDDLAAEADGTIPEKPDFRFLNIDREQWVNTVDPDGIGHMDIDRVDPTIIRSLRSVFVEPKYKTKGLTGAIDVAPAELDGKTALVVDEVLSSGRTLDIAKKFLERAFPSAKVASAHWMRGQAQGAPGSEITGNADLPVWYVKTDVMGRGVGDRDEQISQQARSLTQRLGGWFLSTTFPTVDKAGLQLRRELQQLARDAHDGKTLVYPSIMREGDDFDERAMRLNGLDSMEEFKRRKNEIDLQGKPETTSLFKPKKATPKKAAAKKAAAKKPK